MKEIIKVETALPEGQEKLKAQAQLGEWLTEMQTARPAIGTTIEGLDELIGGLQGLVILGGGPGTGKTALAIQMAQKYAMEGGPVIYLAYEQGPAGVFSRIMQRELGISPRDQRQALQGPEKEEHKATLEGIFNQMGNMVIHGLPFDGSGIDKRILAELIESLQSQTGKLCLLVVDSLHYTPLGSEGASLDGKRAIDQALRTFTSIQEKTKCVVLCIGHQTKGEVRGKSNDLMSFSGSGTIAYAADIAIQLNNSIDGNGSVEITDNGETVLLASVPKNRLGGVDTEGVKVLYNKLNQKMR